MEVLKQNQFSPIAMEKEYAILFTAVNSYLIDIPVEKAGNFIAGLLEYLSLKHSKLLESIAETGAATVELEQELSQAIETYKQLTNKQGIEKASGN